MALVEKLSMLEEYYLDIETLKFNIVENRGWFVGDYNSLTFNIPCLYTDYKFIDLKLLILWTIQSQWIYSQQPIVFYIKLPIEISIINI